MEKIIFYTKLNCHLCEEAYRMLMDLAYDLPLEIDVVDITHSHNQGISAAYEDRIPVLAKPGAKSELNWPFGPDEIRAYLTQDG